MAAEIVFQPEVYEPIDDDEFDDSWHDGQVWRPSNDVDLEPVFLAEGRKELPKVPQLRPSQFTEFAFRMPADDGIGEDGKGYNKFSFNGRRHMRGIYDTSARRILLKCARQVEKSTLLGNIALCYMSLVPAYKVLYVNSSATQAKTFSNDRVKDPIETSPILSRFTTRMLSSNILEKQFINRSKITMRYAFLNADRTRGIPAWLLEVDEIQDVLSDNIPVIEQCLAHAPDRWRRYVYSGTPKSLDNNIEVYWANQSTQNEWAVPHDCKSGESGRYWNILGEKNIGKKGLICGNCGKLIDPMGPDAQWAQMVAYDPEHTPFDGYRISQLMVPWKPWSEILLDYNRYPRDKFYNEVLGISFDSGLRPLTRGQVREACNPVVTMAAKEVEKYRALGYSQPIFAGIDWGTGENSYTVIVLGTYVGNVFRIFYAHRFTGEDVEPDIQIQRIIELIDFFNVEFVMCDYGGGFYPVNILKRRFGVKRIHSVQWMARTVRKFAYDGKMGRWKGARTELMSDVFNAIKRASQKGSRRIIEFPRWEEFREPYAQDMLNIFSEYNERLKMIQYMHARDKPDDTMHAVTYCMLASSLKIPRPDIFVPRREVNGQPVSDYTGPVYQG
jgi:phage terminase large subunit GpA